MNDKHFEKFQYTYKLITERSIRVPSSKKTKTKKNS